MNDYVAPPERARRAYARLQNCKDWDDWIEVGFGLEYGRQEAMRLAGTNRPSGKGYSQQFSAWLEREKLDMIDKADRSRLFACMENRHEINEWRKTLPTNERMRLNHPDTVLKKWKAATRPAPEGEKPLSPMAKLQAEIEVKDGEIARLKHQLAKMEDGNLIGPKERAEDAAPVLADALRHMSKAKAEKALKLALEEVKARPK